MPQHPLHGPPDTEALDPRVIRSRAAILRAAATLLIELGAGGVTIEGISERSGVAKTTIYRHWKSRSQLVFDAFWSLFPEVELRVFEGTIREQLTTLVSRLIVGVTSSEWAPAIPALVDASARDAELRNLIREFLDVSMEPGRDMLRAAMARGERRPDLDVDVAIDLLVAPIFYRRLVSFEELDETLAAPIVDQFFRGAEACREQA